MNRPSIEYDSDSSQIITDVQIRDEEEEKKEELGKLLEEKDDQNLVYEDIKTLLNDLEVKAIRDIIIKETGERDTVDYTWDEMMDMYITRTSRIVTRKHTNWRPNAFETIRDLMRPEFNIKIPQPIEVPSTPLETGDSSTESDEPSKPKPRIYPFRMRHDNLNAYTSTYWQARGHVTNLRVGNDVAIITTLSMMADLDFNNEEVPYGIVDCGGLETLMNLAVINSITMQLGSLQLLNRIADHPVIKRTMVNQGVPHMCFKLLPHYEYDVVIICSEILLKVSDLKCFRPVVRGTEGLEVMLEIAELPDKYYNMPESAITDDVELKIYTAAKNCLLTIKNTHRSRLVRIALYKLGFVRLLKKIIYSRNKFFKDIGLQMVYEASSCKLYQQIFILEDFMKYTLDTYQLKKPETPDAIMMLKTINKCLDDEQCRYYLLSNGLVEFQIKQLKTLGHRKQLKHTLASLVRFLKIKKYRMMMHKSDLIPGLLQLFKHTNPLVREYSGRIVAELSRYEDNHDILIGEQNLGLIWLIDMCENLLDYDLLAHVYKIVMELSYVPTIYWWVADRLEIIPLLWAAVTNPNPRCIEYGCSALVPYIGPIPGSHDTVRRIDGGVFDLMSLTYNEDDGAKAGALTLLSRMACEQENLDILARLGFIDRLFDLSKTAKHPRLRYAIGLCFGSCGHDRKRSFKLGERGAVTILVEWLLNDNDSYVQLGVVSGLWKLSYELINCMVMIKYQIVEVSTTVI
ncbi:unnamed protein product [Nezara viridula]|uniref:Uncharacterized protein n=1 Tax=Nezara viridula TaxID=85310 RepID=A0A9P0E323_NEZVI|nr:unnamed protein product [Nezara viridula]